MAAADSSWRQKRYQSLMNENAELRIELKRRTNVCVLCNQFITQSAAPTPATASNDVMRPPLPFGMHFPRPMQAAATAMPVVAFPHPPFLPYGAPPTTTATPMSPPWLLPTPSPSSLPVTETHHDGCDCIRCMSEPLVEEISSTISKMKGLLQQQDDVRIRVARARRSGITHAWSRRVIDRDLVTIIRLLKRTADEMSSD